MLTIEWFRDKTIVVMGLGLNGGGVGVSLWLMRHGAKVLVTDIKDEKALATSVATLEKTYAAEKKKPGAYVHPFRYALGRHDEADFRRAAMVIQNPGVPRDSHFLAVAKESGARIENEIGIFFQLCPFPILGVTGTRGKTTTTLMLAEIFKRFDPRTVVAGNLRVSALAALDKLLVVARRGGGVGGGKVGNGPVPVLLELSSWQLEGLEPVKMSPHVAVVTNLFEDHLNRYRNMAEYALAKATAIAFQRMDDVAVVNADNDWTYDMATEPDPRTDAKPASRIVWFSAKRLAGKRDGACVIGKDLVWVENGKATKIMPMKMLPVAGEHNVMNALAAISAAQVWGVPMKMIVAGLKSFAGAPFRQELVANIKGVRWINDTTATSPDGAIVALRTFGDAAKKRVVLIAGGADKALVFEAWAKEVKKYVKHLVMFDGVNTLATPRMRDALARAKAVVAQDLVANMAEAVLKAATVAKRGDVVLLSPGCASFGIFVNEFDRGEKFVKEVMKLSKSAGRK